MVLADSGRITRVPPYLGFPPVQQPISPTGLSPSVARLSRRLGYQSLVHLAAPLPHPNFLRWFGLFRVRSPLLAESLLFSFPPGTEMFHFPGFARYVPIYSARRKAALPALGFPIRISPDQCLVSGSPTLFAATHVLLRLLSPRHPSCALCSLVSLFLSSSNSSSRPRSIPVGACFDRSSSSPYFVTLLRICSCQRPQEFPHRSGADRDRTDDI